MQSFLSTSRGSLLIRARTLSQLHSVAWRSWPCETGGILLGHTGEARSTVSVCIGPGPEAKHARYGFTPDANWQAARVAEAWSLDESVEYLGDWHTHPGGTTRFSELDRQAAVTISEAPAARQPRPVMLVLALGQNGHARMAASYLVNGRLRAAKVIAVGEPN